jgi:hypothetical protein
LHCLASLAFFSRKARSGAKHAKKYRTQRVSLREICLKLLLQFYNEAGTATAAFRLCIVSLRSLFFHAKRAAEQSTQRNTARKEFRSAKFV